MTSATATPPGDAGADRQSDPSLRRMLLVRIGLVALAVALVVGPLAFFLEEKREEQFARDRTLIRTGILADLVEDGMDLQQALDAVFPKRRDLQGGRIVFMRALSADGAVLAEHKQADFHALAAVERHARETPFAPKTAVDVWTPDPDNFFERSLVPLSNVPGTPWVESYFWVSDAEERHFLAVLAESMGLALGAVLLTALILYPVIARLVQRLGRLSRHLLDANLEALQALGSAIAKRDSDTDVHNFRVTIYSVHTAEAMGLDDETIRVLIRGAFIHDVGKIGVADRVLLKPGKLTDDEFEEMKKHVDYGVEIVAASHWLGQARDVVASHHEKFDGSGYGSRLRGGDIPLLARIFAVADVFDALTSERPYKKPLPFDDACAILVEGRGSHFDPRVLDAFLPIARGLHEQFANQPEDIPKRAARALIDKYYRAGLAGMV